VSDDKMTALATWIGEARWFGGKGREWTLASVRRVGEVPGAPDGLRVTIELAELTFTSAGPEQADETELYQLPLAFYAEPDEHG
jgi:maltokinase